MLGGGLSAIPMLYDEIPRRGADTSPDRVVTRLLPRSMAMRAGCGERRGCGRRSARVNTLCRDCGGLSISAPPGRPSAPVRVAAARRP